MENARKRKIFKLIYWIVVAAFGVFIIGSLINSYLFIFYPYDKWFTDWMYNVSTRKPLNIMDMMLMVLLYISSVAMNFKTIFEKKKVSSIIISILLVVAFIMQYFSCYLAADLARSRRTCAGMAPVIYLYPEEEIDAVVEVDLNGEFTCTYPKYAEDGWQVTANPDGTLTDESGRTYDFLYWEGLFYMDPDLSKGFCVKGEDSAKFLEDSLSLLGLNESEANTFIMYWLPILEENEYNVITFQSDAYEEAAKLTVTPEPDNVIRVNMYFWGSDEYVEIEPQDLASINNTDRSGFTVVEWGGENMGHS